MHNSLLFCQVLERDRSSHSIRFSIGAIDLFFLKSARSLESVPETMGRVPEIRKAFEVANQANLTREELEELEKREI